VITDDRFMPRLVAPTADVAESYRAALAELDELDGGWRLLPDHDLDTAEGFAGFLDRLRAMETAPPDHLVASTTLWWVDGAEYLGRISVRHHLTPALRVRGGHIGYDVRPSARRRGHATAMLQAVLPVAARLGIDPALITTDTDNIASQRVIRAAGGVPEPGDEAILHFWVPTSRGRAAS
jgi:predicted acetyltransferase